MLLAGQEITFLGMDINTHHLLHYKMEVDMIARFCQWLRPTDILYDIGAGAGAYSLPASYYCQEVFAWEPFPQHQRTLRLNILANHRKNIYPQAMALSNHVSKIILQSSPNYCPSSVVPPQKQAKDREVQIVPCMPLDDFLEKGYPAPTVIKMDIEGSEQEALDGMIHLFQERPPRLMQIEFHPQHLHYKGYRVEELLAPLLKRGYKSLITQVRGDEIFYILELT